MTPARARRSSPGRRDRRLRAPAAGGARVPWRPWLLPAAWLVLALPPQAMAAQSAATFWALNCRGCHSAPPGHRPSQPPGVGQFAQTEGGRIFFFDLPADGTPMPADQDARLWREILTWKASCHVILQAAPSVRYTGQAYVR